MANLNMLIGRTISSIYNDDDSMIHIETNDGERFRFIHHQSCCESVYIESIVGDLDSLVGNPVLVAEERSYDGDPLGDPESFTWTFYVLATIKGHVDIRWYGSSNGYYSESVNFEWLNKDKPRPTWGRRGVNSGYGVWE